MMPTTPMGVAMRWMSSPLGRVQRASSRPTGSGSAAISSSPFAIASMREGSSVRRSRIGAPAPCAALTCCAFAARISADRLRRESAAANRALSFAARWAWRRIFDASFAFAPRCASDSSESCLSLLIDRDLFRHERHIVPMDHLVAPAITQYRLDLGTFPPLDLPCIRRAIGRQSARQFAALSVADAHRVAPLEFAIYLAHARRKQAFALH